MANRVFDLEAVVSILTGKAETSLNSLDKRVQATADNINRISVSSSAASKDLGGISKGADQATNALNGLSGVSFKNLAGLSALNSLINTGINTALGAVKDAVFGTAAAFADFDGKLYNFNSVAKLSEKDLAAYSEQIRTLGRDLKLNVGSAQAAAAAYDIASAGFAKASDNAMVIESSLKGAAAGNEEAATSANLLVGSLRAYGAEADQSAHFMDVFFKTVDLGITTFPQLAASLGNVSSIASNAGVSIEELGAVIATTTNRGIKTSVAVDGIRGAITNLLAPSSEAQKELAAFGLTVNEQTLKQKGLVQTLLDIQKATGGSAQSFKTILGDVQAFNVAIALTKDEGALVSQNLEKLRDSTGATDAALAQQAKSVNFQMGQLKVAAEAAAITLGGAFAGSVAGAIQQTTELVTGFDNLLNSFKDVNGSITGGLLDAFEKNFPATAAMLEQIKGTANELIQVFLDMFGSFGGAEADAARGAIDFLLSGLLKLADIVLNAVGIIAEFVKAVVKGFELAAVVVGAAVGSMGTAWGTAVDGMLGLWENFTYKVDKLWQALIDKILDSIQALPGQLRGSLGEVETSLLRTRSALAKSQAPKQSVADNLKSIVGSKDIVTSSISSAIADFELRQNKKATPAKDNGFVGPVATPSDLKGAAKSTAPTVTAPPVKGFSVEDLKARAKALEQEIQLGKVSQAQAVERYQAILNEAKAAKLSGDDVFKVEKSLFDLRKKMEVEQTKAAEKRKQLQDKMRVEYLKNVKGEMAGLLEALDQEKAERMKAGVDSVELEAWYGAQRRKIFADEAKKKAEIAKKADDALNKIGDTAAEANQDVLAAQGKNLEAELAGLKQQEAEAKRSLKEQYDEVLKNKGDKLQAEREYQAALKSTEDKFNAERLKAAKDFAKAKADEESGIQADTLRNQAAVEKDPQKAAEKSYQADNIDKLKAIKDRVEAARKAGVDEVVIARYVASEQKKIRDGAKADAQASEGSSSPLKSFSEAFSSGFGLGSFSLGGGKNSDPAAVKAANQLANDVGKLASPSSTDGQSASINDLLTIQIIDQNNNPVATETVKRGANDQKTMKHSYKLGRF